MRSQRASIEVRTAQMLQAEDKARIAIEVAQEPQEARNPHRNSDGKRPQGGAAA